MHETQRPKLNMIIFIICLLCFIIPAIIYYSCVINRQERWENEQKIKSVTSLDRGEWSERDLILELLNLGILAQTIFHDLYVETVSGNFSQIDLVVATKVGIIVFEVKDYSGWLFGNGNNTKWTQVLAYGQEKHRFYNPIMQNDKHIKHLKKVLWRESIPFYSVIVFYGDCELREISFVPKRTLIVRPYQIAETINFIIGNNQPANYKNSAEVMALLKKAVDNGANIENRKKHIENIQKYVARSEI